jgi:XTP/dITP diphosphohydrolase
MKTVLATGNSGKVREFSQLCDEEIVPYSSLVAPFEIEETGTTFAQNALIKAQSVFEAIGRDDVVVLADDSGISVPRLGGAPGIYSARYAGEGASDKENLQKLIDTLKSEGIARTPAFYTAAIAAVGVKGAYVVHGWMHGEVIDEARGDKGFGYDPMFIPEGYEKTLGELDDAIKSAFSHRARATALIKPVVAMLKRSAR